MFRVRIALVAAAVVAVVTGGYLVYLRNMLQDTITRQVELEVEHAGRQMLRSAQFEALDLKIRTERLVHDEEFAKVFAANTPEDRKRAAFVAVEVHQARIEKQEGRKAAILAVLDQSGAVVARDLNFSALAGVNLAARYPAIQQMLRGTLAKDVWHFDGAMYRVGLAPIRGAGGVVLGGVLLGYVQSVADAQADKERLGTEVAYFLDGQIHASSFSRGEGQRSESGEEAELAVQLQSKRIPALARLDDTAATLPLFRVTLGGSEWIATAAPLPDNATARRSGFVVLSSLAVAKGPIAPVTRGLLLVGVVGMLATIGAAARTARRFLVPLDRLEAEINEVINGNRDRRFSFLSPDFEGLANLLNAMLDRLLGRAEIPDVEEEGGLVPGNRWPRDAVFGDEAKFGPVDASPGDAAALAAEPVEQYYQRTWREFAAARQHTGEGLDGIAMDTFIAKLKRHEEALAKKYGVRAVRFKVEIKGSQTTLKPVPLS